MMRLPSFDAYKWKEKNRFADAQGDIDASFLIKILKPDQKLGGVCLICKDV